MSFSFFYQFVKDLVAGAENRRTTRLSAQQIDLNIMELDRRLDAEIRRLQRKGEEERARFRAKVGASGIRLDGSPEEYLRSIVIKESQEIDILRGESEYLRKMLLLEKAKLIPMDPASNAIDETPDAQLETVDTSGRERR